MWKRKGNIQETKNPRVVWLTRENIKQKKNNLQKSYFSCLVCEFWDGNGKGKGKKSQNILLFYYFKKLINKFKPELYEIKLSYL